MPARGGGNQGETPLSVTNGRVVTNESIKLHTSARRAPILSAITLYETVRAILRSTPPWRDVVCRRLASFSSRFTQRERTGEKCHRYKKSAVSFHAGSHIYNTHTHIYIYISPRYWSTAISHAITVFSAPYRRSISFCPCNRLNNEATRSSNNCYSWSKPTNLHKPRCGVGGGRGGGEGVRMKFPWFGGAKRKRKPRACSCVDISPSNTLFRQQCCYRGDRRGQRDGRADTRGSLVDVRSLLYRW